MAARSAGPRLLIVTAVLAERESAAAELAGVESAIGPYRALSATTPFGRVDLIAGGAGPAASAAATATALTVATYASAPYSLVLSAGVAGGFAPATLGETIVAAAVVQADLGAQSPSGFLPADAIGLGPTRTVLSPRLVAELAARCGARAGTVLTVSTVTGTAPATADLLARYPDALAEAMEGAGVLAAARAHEVAFGEVRTISNVVGPRDRSSWQLGTALAALTAAISAIVSRPLEEQRNE